ncbi:golgin subfamily B member 1-like isoform X3 [Myxocyprinus asiaticus]|uniref:golgin subfamily B member 1-like isoform X3 n=1 Tax=Myxocyprinus asiaticus TaxID=70543 RepID=UPI002222DD2E|nr:golgin subfamily B member 1-like isoform X3 [Myxocyprinus asiaticus]
MLKWFSADEGGSAHGAPGSPLVDVSVNAPTLSEVTERLMQMEELVTQLKELIREKDATLCSKDEQLKVERESYELKLSKIRLQNKAKVTSLNSQLEELRKNQERKEQGSPARFKQSGTGEAGDSESAAANRGKILRFRKKVEDLEQQVAQRDQELKQKIQELEAQRERGSAMDAMLADRAKLLTEKEAYIVHLQMALSGEQPVPQQSNEGSVNELKLMVLSLTKNVGDGEERCSLLQEQVDSLRELLMSEKTQFEEKENMYKSNIQTFKDIILQKDNTLMEIRQTHEQELFKLVAKSDASADLEQLLTALKQKLHEKEEVLLGKTQVIDVLQVEVDGRDQQIKELTEGMQHLQRERENLQSKLEAERHIARARLRDLMEKHEAELQRAAEKHNSEMSEKEQALRRQLETLQRSTALPSDVPANPPTCITAQRITELEAHAKLKADEASKAEAKFLKMKAWSKSRIRQLEEELRKVQSGICTNMSPDVTSLRSRVTELEEEREEMFCKLELYEEMKAKNDELQKQLVEYEDQQRKMQADLEQVTKRAASQASETGSMDDFQSQVMEWQEMVTMVMESEGVRDQGHEKHAMAFRMSHIEEEREGLIEDDWLFPGCSDPALAKRQQDVEEELAQAHGLHPQKSRKPKHFTPRSLQEDLEFHNRQSFPDPKDSTGCDVFMDGENMGGWWPKHGAADTDGLRSVVEELELERNQLQEQILGLEERCQDLEDRLQLQARIELLQVTFGIDEGGRAISQNELERLQAQVTSLRSQQVKDAEKHQLLVTSLNEQLKGLNSTQECLESSLIEKEHTLAKTSEKLECIESLREALRTKEKQHKDTAEKLLQTEHNLAEVMKKCSIFEKENSEVKATVAELTQKISVLKDKMQKHEVTIESLQSDLVQTNDELDRLNIAHLEERAQLIHDMQSCERKIDSLKDIITDKDKEILALSSSTTEYSEQIHELKQQIKLKEAALANVEPEVQTIRDPQHSDQQSFNTLIAELMEQLKKTESDLNVAKIEGESKSNDIKGLMKQIEEDKKTIQDLRMDIQKLNMNQKDQLLDSELMLEKELKFLKEERNKLLAEVTKHESELQTLSRELEEKFACQEPLKQDVQEKSKMIFSLEQRLQIVQEEAEGERTRYRTELKTRDETNEQLEKELSGKNESITKMKAHIKSLQNDNQKLKDSLEENFEELEKQKQLLDNVKKEMHAVQDQNSSLLLQVKSLMDENCRLKQIIETGSQSLSDVLEEKNILLAKISEAELQLLGSKKTIENLQKENEDLTLRGAELKKELEQSKQSMSVMLLEKSNECSQHSTLLRESGEIISSLQVQIESLNNQADQSNSCMAEKERTIAEKNALIESQKCQLLQLQEALTRFQEQEATLKAELTEKDDTMKFLKEECNQLTTAVTKQKSEIHNISKQFEEQVANQEQLKQDVQEKSKKIFSLEQRLQFVQEEAEEERTRYSTEIKTRDEAMEKLEKELSGKNESITKMKAHFKSLKNDNQKLKESLEENFEELEKQKQLLDNVKKEMHAVQDQNSSLLLQVRSLTDENCRLKQIIETGSQSLSDVLEEKNILLAKISETELQLLGSEKTIEDLQKEKEDLTLRGAELKKELEQSKQSMSVMLLEKSNECSQHSTLLRESGEIISSLQVQVESLNSQANQSNSCMAEKERTIAEKNALIESQKCQLLQLQEALTQFQEQEATLKAELTEKDGTMKFLKEECNQLTTAVTKQKSEIHNISKQFEEQVASQEQLKQDVQEKSKKIFSLEQRLKIVQEEAEGERTRYSTEIKTRDEAMGKLEKELSGKNESITKMKAHFKSLKNDNQKLKESLEENLGEFVRQKQLLDNAKEDMHAVQDQSSSLLLQVKSLTEDNCRLKQIIETGSQSLSDVSEQKNILLAKISEVELQLLESAKTIEDLQKEKEDLTLRGAELKKELEQNKQSMSEMLLEKSNECSQHNTLLRESKEIISSLQVQVESLNNQVDQSNSCMVEKENTIGEKNALIDSQKCQLLQLQEAITQLHELEATLKSELMEKDGIIQAQSAQGTSLQSELQQQRQYLSKVQSEFDSLKNECTQLTGSLQKSETALSNRTHECQTHIDELRERSESVALLSEQLAAVNKINVRLESEIMAMKTAQDILFSDKNKLEEELAQIQARAVRLNDHVQSLNSQNQQLQAMFEGKEKEVLLLTQVVSETNNKVAITTKENENLVSQVVSLCEQNKNLQEQTTEQTKSLTEMTKETNALQNKISILETQDVENNKIIEDLFKHMEGLLLQAEELKVFKQKQQSGAESLQEMSSECAALSKRLGEAEEEVALLKGELESSSSQIIHYNRVVLEKDKILKDQSTQMEAYQHQLEHLHETLSILKEQANAHNSGLIEKDVLLQKESNSCSLLQKELGHERELVLNLQHEIESLKVECSRLNHSLEAQQSSLREKTLESQNHKEELVKRNEYVLSLTAQLGIMNENNVKLKSENANLKCTLEQHSTESARLKEELRQKQLELVEHQDNVQALTEQNSTIKSELKRSVAELFRQQEMITSLQSELATRNEKLASLTEQIETEHSGNDVLQLTLQEKEAALRAQEMHVNKLQDKLLESESQISQKIKVISELQIAAQSFQTALQDKDNLLLNKEQEFSLVKTALMAESEACKAQQKLEMDAVATLQRDLQNLLEKNKHLMSVVDEKDFLLRQEQEKYLCLQGSAAELENTKSQLNCQIKRLTLEAAQLRETQTEKEQVVFAAQSQIQKLDELYKKLQEEYNLTKQELYKVINEKSLKEEEVCKLVLEKEEICRNSSLQIQRIQEQVQHDQQQSCTMNDMEEEMKMEREQLHIQQESMWGTDVSPEHWVQLHSRLQHSQLEIQQREFGLQQLNIKLQQAIEEKAGVSAQLSTVSQMLRDTQETVNELQNRCYWLERQSQIQYSAVQGSVSAEVPPGAPQERVSALHIPDASDSRDLRIRLTEAELHLSQLNSRLEEERSRREAAEEAVRLTEQRVTSMESNTSWSSQRDFSIELETDEEQYEALILDPNQHLLMRKMKSGVHLCRRWLKGRSTYCSKLLTSRAKSRYIFMAYLLTLHVLVFMCLSGAL